MLKQMKGNATKYCACHDICTWPCESIAPATKWVHSIAKVLRLPRNLYLRLPRNLTRPCERAALATKSVPDLAKVLRLPRDLHAPPCALAPMGFAMRPCQRCGNAAPATKSILGLAKVLRLPRNIPRPCESSAPATKFYFCEASALLLQWAPVPGPSEQAPRQRYLSHIFGSDFLRPARLLRILYLFAHSDKMLEYCPCHEICSRNS